MQLLEVYCCATCMSTQLGVVAVLGTEGTTMQVRWSADGAPLNYDMDGSHPSVCATGQAPCTSLPTC